MLSNWPNGSLPATVGQSMALLGLAPDLSGPELRWHVTQSSGRPQFNPATMPVPLAERLESVDGMKGRSRQPETVQVLDVRLQREN